MRFAAVIFSFFATIELNGIRFVDLLEFVVAMNVGENSRIDSNNREDDAKQCNCCKLIDKLHSNIHDTSCGGAIMKIE
jgi:hypothetical protein